MSVLRTVGLILALAAPSFANSVYADFNTSITTFNAEVDSWNSGPSLGFPAFNADILTFDSAVDAFNLATSGSYAGVSAMGAYGNVGPYPGASAAIDAYNTAVTSFNSAIGNFSSGALDRPDFTADVDAFNAAVFTFNATSPNPPVSPALALPDYSEEPTVTDPGLATPEPSSAGLLAMGLVIGFWVKRINGAGDGNRTRDQQLGRL